MKNYPFILYILLSSCLFQCKNVSTNEEKDLEKSKKEIRMPIYIDRTKSYDKKHLILQDVAEIKYVCLETKDECLLHGVMYMTEIKCTNSDIFILDKNEILRFNNEGKYLNHIGKSGNGPGEYSSIYYFIVNEKNKEIVLCEIYGKRLMFYDFNGNFVKEVKIDVPMRSMELLTDSMLVCQSSNIKISPSLYFCSLNTGEMTKVLAPPYQKYIGVNYSIVSNEMPRKYNNEAYFNSDYTDTIFSVNKNGVFPRYILFPPTNGKTLEDDVNCVSIRLLCETSQYSNIFLLGRNGKEPTAQSFILNKKDGTITEGFLVSREYPKALSPFDSGIDDQIVIILEAHVLKQYLEQGKISGELKIIAEKVDADDNPVLMIAKIKK